MRALLCALLAVTLTGAAAPEVERGGRMLFEAAPAERMQARVGEWVTYQMDGAAQRGFMRLAVVGEQKDAQGRDAVWLELEFGQHAELKAPLAQFLMLVARETGLRREGISRLFATQGFERLQEVDADAMPFFLGKADTSSASSSPAPATARLPAGQGASVNRGSPTRIMTLAGSVTAEPMEVFYRRLVLKRYWVSREIPLLHLAKIEFPPIGYTMEVRDHGVDARPRIVLPAPGTKKIRMGPESDLPPYLKPLPSEPKESTP